MKNLLTFSFLVVTTFTFIGKSTEAGAVERWRYCATYSDWGRTTETSIVETAQRVEARDPRNLEADRLSIHKYYFGQRISPLFVESFLPLTSDCKPTPDNLRKLAWPPVPAPEVVPASVFSEFIRTETKSWNKTEDAPADGSVLRPRRQFQDSIRFDAKPNEKFCGWRLKQTRMYNSVWRAIVDNNGVIFAVKIPSNTRQEGSVILEFTARFIQKDLPLDNYVLQCAEANSIFPSLGWRMDTAELNAYATDLTGQTPVPPSMCQADDGTAYPCGNPPTGTTPRTSCGPNCRRF